MKNKFILVCFGIILLVWSRLHIRVPKELTDFLLVFCVLGLIFNLYILIKTLKFLLFPNNNINYIFKKLSSYSLIARILEKINEILNYPKDIIEEYASNYSLGRKKLKLYTSYFVAYFNYPKSIVFIFFFFIRLLLSIVFLLEIIFFNKLHYFYYLIPYLLIPLVIKSYIDLVKFQSQNSKEFSEHHLHVIIRPNEICFMLKEEPPNIPEAFTIEKMQKHSEYLMDTWYICHSLLLYFNSIEKEEDFYRPYISLITAVCYIIGWSYIIITQL